jgi:hypothetical protein
MFRFTIRDVLWLTVVVAMGVGWYANRRSWSANLEIERGERNAQIIRLRQERDIARDEAKTIYWRRLNPNDGKSEASE